MLLGTCVLLDVRVSLGLLELRVFFGYIRGLDSHAVPPSYSIVIHFRKPFNIHLRMVDILEEQYP